MSPQIHNLNLFADYFQFYVCDEAILTDTSTIWDTSTTDRMLALGDDLIAVGTARNMDVPVTLELLDAEPVLDLTAWDQVIECGVSIPSGKVIAFGCTDSPDEADRFAVDPGRYCVRVSYGRLDEISDDGLEGGDHYRVQLWPGAKSEVTVLKRRPASVAPSV